MNIFKHTFAFIRRFLGFVASLIGLIAAVVYEAIGYRELLLFAGTGLLSYGAALIFPPAAYIVPGVVFTGVAVFGVRA